MASEQEWGRVRIAGRTEIRGYAKVIDEIDETTLRVDLYMLDGTCVVRGAVWAREHIDLDVEVPDWGSPPSREYERQRA